MGPEAAGAVISVHRLFVGIMLALAASGCTTTPVRTAERDRIPQTTSRVPSLWGTLAAGPYQAGFRTEERISIWYPALSDGRPMHLRDYAASTGEVEAFLSASKTVGPDASPYLDALMFARRDALAVSRTEDSLPVVLIILKEGLGAADHAVLGEFLASHGYIVALAPARADLHSVHPALYLHNVDVTTGDFLVDPAEAAARAGQLLAFLVARRAPSH